MGRREGSCSQGGPIHYGNSKPSLIEHHENGEKLNLKVTKTKNGAVEVISKQWHSAVPNQGALLCLHRQRKVSTSTAEHRERSRMEPPFGFFYSQVQGGKARAL